MPIINGINVPFVPAGGIQKPSAKSIGKNENSINSSFNNIFNSELNKLNFSSHAQTRLKSRGIELDNNQMNRLNKAFESVSNKGGKDSLILLDQNAFIINVPNRTVITALDKNNLETNVITNIDSAVVA